MYIYIYTHTQHIGLLVITRVSVTTVPTYALFSPDMFLFDPKNLCLGGYLKFLKIPGCTICYFLQLLDTSVVLKRKNTSITFSFIYSYIIILAFSE